MRKWLISVLTGLAFLPTLGAHADTPSDNPVTVNQAVNLKLATTGNVSNIVQVGSENYAETEQIGSMNFASVGQFGNDNYAKVVQNSVGAVAIYNQYGNGNQVTITQTGVNPQPVVVTQHR
jgi:minor curlin subunit